MSNVIKSISFDQKEILYNIMQLHNNGEPFECDITYSSGKFYEPKKNDKYVIPYPSLKMDVFPIKEDVIKIEPFKPLPLEDNSISSIVIDLPFVIAVYKNLRNSMNSHFLFLVSTNHYFLGVFLPCQP